MPRVHFLPVRSVFALAVALTAAVSVRSARAGDRVDRLLHEAAANQQRITHLEQRLSQRAAAGLNAQRAQVLREQIRTVLSERAFRESLGGGREGVWEYAAGLNYYIRGENVKLQADVTRIPEVPITSGSHSLANVNDDALVFRMQLQVAF